MELFEQHNRENVKVKTSELAMEINCALEEFFEGTFVCEENQIRFALANGQVFLLEIKDVTA